MASVLQPGSVPEGGTITALDPLPSDPNVVRIRVDGRIAARLPQNEVDRLELSVGQRWTTARARAVAEAIALIKARREALRLLGRRAMSRQQLVDRLCRRHDPAVATRVVDELEDGGWIDDEAYARDLAASVQRKQPAGAALIEQRLRQRGVEAALASRIAQEAATEEPPDDAAMRLARAHLDRMSSDTPAAARARRVAGLLARRGFDEQTVHDTLEGLRLADPTDDAS